jgi:Raf kinase inhibitor-like YbhB/YbcL family protein
VRRAALVAGVGLLLAACGGSSAPRPRPETVTVTPTTPKIRITSPAFASGGPIPRQYTCDGRDVSLPLRWSDVPAKATELLLTMVDPDAPGGLFIHWAMRFPATVHALATGQVPAGARVSRNGFGKTGYGGPCPPRGAPAHHYVINMTAVAGRSIVATGTLTGTYARP